MADAPAAGSFSFPSAAVHIADVTMFYAARSGGIRRYLDTKREWLRARECRHTLLVPARNGCPIDAATLALPSVPLPLSAGYRLPLGVRRTAKELVRVRPHLIEAGDPYHLAWAALRARDVLRVPAVFFCHSDLPRLVGARYGVRAERLAARYCRRLYRQFDVVLAPSEFLARKLKLAGVPQVERQALGVDVTVFDPHRRSAMLRRRLEADANTRVLVYAGRFAAEKNLDRIVEAMRALDRRYLLVLIGSGELPQRLPANVRVLPFVGDTVQLATLLASCDAFVHAGDQETYGLAVLEAMACGLPVVGAAAAGVEEMLAQGGGVLVAPRSAEALAAGIKQLFASDVASVGHAARRTAERHAWQPLLEQMLVRYRTLAAH